MMSTSTSFDLDNASSWIVPCVSRSTKSKTITLRASELGEFTLTTIQGGFKKPSGEVKGDEESIIWIHN